MSLKHFGIRGRQQPETDQVNKCSCHTGYDIFLKLKGIHRGKDYNTSEEVKTMTRIEGSREINAPPEKVSQYMWNVNNLRNYLPISDVEILERGENVVKLRHKLRAAGRTMDLVCEHKMLEKNRKMVYKVTKGMKLEGTWLLEPTEKGTKLINIMEYKPPGWIFGKIIDKLKVRKEMTRICSESLRTLKRILEA